MKFNKALVKHESRNMKWMLVYFLSVVIGAVTNFSSDLNSGYRDFLTNGISPDNTVILFAVKNILAGIVIPMGIGILLMIYLQFKDSKSVEVGNFLKGLPISNREYYVTKFLGGLISLTVPLLILIGGILAIRSNNMAWVSDIHAVSVFPELVMKIDSVINIASVLAMSYLVAVSTYAFLFMVQYIVMDITAGLVVGSLVWLSPTFIIMSIGVIYGEAIQKVIGGSEGLLPRIEELIFTYIEPWSYPFNTSSIDAFTEFEYSPMFDYSQIIYFKGVGLKIVITLGLALISIALGYILAKKSRVEDSDSLISFRWARRLFILGVTVCSVFLFGDLALMFFGMYDSIGFVLLHIMMIIGGIIGYLVSRKMTRVKSK